ncbi:DMSO/TMAO reductase YedYZ, molybdopterin-dependent catalytic subunit [Actinacidiphila yanglinensis]|uniref:DMSO/TMAO reductase YedYZ, molybdopterin-dependent catalytic subunit n=1 Tax=Actinacidiphila yanglinensis TaxID=310779 RepID=A0A1H5TGS0_9ACTN|nr:sulfite oxidase-like oxidoreductase [Actinacidiphila yanglinensis]SEF61964.1 DMSO/TMAO reductase YedYZ, molybdopterin-dependent catalytic subunit [Actinacidiphila yanglinensis]
MGRYEHPEGQLPPGQRLQRGWPVTHYGPVPRFRPDRWDFRVFGATAHGERPVWNHEEFSALPYATVVADFHCVTKFSMTGMEWGGVATATVAKLAPPASDVTHVMVWAEYGFSSNLRIDDFLDGLSIFATHESGQPLTAEHGFPVRLVVPKRYAWKGPKWVRGIEYMTADRRGFWEERGYHNLGDPWSEQRFSFQEEPGDGPEL